MMDGKLTDGQRDFLLVAILALIAVQGITQNAGTAGPIKAIGFIIVAICVSAILVMMMNPFGLFDFADVNQRGDPDDSD